MQTLPSIITFSGREWPIDVWAEDENPDRKDWVEWGTCNWKLKTVPQVVAYIKRHAAKTGNGRASWHIVHGIGDDANKTPYTRLYVS